MNKAITKAATAIKNFIKERFMSEVITSQHIHRVFFTNLWSFHLKNTMGSFTLLHKLCPTVNSSPKIIGRKHGSPVSTCHWKAYWICTHIE